MKFQNVLKECVMPVADSLKHLVDTAPSGAMTSVHKMIKAVESGLSYQFHSAWGLVIQIYAVFFEVLVHRADICFYHQFAIIKIIDKLVKYSNAC
jgi:hypothetical protein